MADWAGVFKCFESIMLSQGNCDNVVLARVSKATGKFAQLHYVRDSKHLDLKLNLRIRHDVRTTCVYEVLLVCYCNKTLSACCSLQYCVAVKCGC